MTFRWSKTSLAIKVAPISGEFREVVLAQLHALGSEWRGVLVEGAEVLTLHATRLGRRERRRERIKAEVAARHRGVLAKHVAWSWRDGGCGL